MTQPLPDDDSPALLAAANQGHAQSVAHLERMIAATREALNRGQPPLVVSGGLVLAFRDLRLALATGPLAELLGGADGADMVASLTQGILDRMLAVAIVREARRTLGWPHDDHAP